MRRGTKLAFLVLGFQTWLLGQSTNGSIIGTIKDPQASGIPGAQVTVENLDNGRKIETQADATGNYTGFPLSPGRYDVRAVAGGFRSTNVSGVRVDVDSRVRVDIVMSLATLQESVTVEASGATLVQTDSSSLESVVENRQILDLPLDGRDINDLVYLTPGTMENTTTGVGGFVADGNRPWGNNFLIDGVSNRNESRGASSLSVSVDAVQEFKVKKSNASAEFGGAGTTVTLAVKSGTNQLHGSLFEFNRSKLGQARDFFSSTNDLPPFVRNQFGGTLGGPIRRDHTFFFVNYEGSRITSSQGQLSSVPTVEMRNGDFRGITDVNGKPLTLAVPTPLPFMLVSGQPLFSAPNVINPFYLADSASNPNRANVQIAKAVLDYYALPNLPGMVNNLSSTVPSDSSSNQFTARIDHRLGDKHSLSFRFTSSSTTSGGNNPVAPSLGSTSNPYQRNMGGSLNSVLRPTLINELRVGLQNHMQQKVQSPPRDFVKEFGIPEPVPLPQVPSLLNRIPTFSFLGNGQFNRLQYTVGGGQFGAYGGDNTNMQEGNDNLSFSDTLTWRKGSHEWKTGYQVNYIPIVSAGTPASRGSLSYNGKANALSSGYSVADALLGLPSGTQFVLFPSDFHFRVWQQAAFLQDDWRISNRLTLNMGVRWDVRPPATETGNQRASFDLALGKTVVASPGGKISDKAYPMLLQKFANSFVTATQAGWDEQRLLQTNWNDWGPRIGFALRLDRSSSFVLRGSYGIFYSFSPYYTLGNFSGGSGVPFSLISQVNTSAADQLTNQNPFRALSAGTQAVSGQERVSKDNSNQQWNLTLERAVLRESTVSLSYVGNRGAHLLGTFNYNILKPKAYPDFGNITLSNAVSNSWYHAMQVEFRRRYSRGFFYQMNWTWAKSIDDVSQGTGGSNMDVVALNRRLNRADSDLVRRHTARINALYEFPVGRKHHLGANWHPVLDALVGGWSLGGIVSLNTGQFATPTVQGGAFTGRPDRVLGVPINLSDADRKSLAQQTGDSSYLDPTKRWFNPFAFRSVDVGEGRIGNAGRNTIVGPNFFGADVSLSKRFHLPKLPERASALIRADAFNMLNHPNFGVGRTSDAALNAIINSNNAGAFTRTLNSSRQFQFSFRLDF